MAAVWRHIARLRYYGVRRSNTTRHAYFRKESLFLGNYTSQAGSSLPVVVMLSLPCFTPLAPITRFASAWIAEVLPRTTNTSRQL